MNKKIVTLLTAFCLLSVSAVFAAAEPLWTHDFGKKVNWTKVSETGTPIVGAADGLYGVKGETGEVLWTNNNLKDLIVETYEAMPNTPYIIITPEAKPKKAKNRLRRISRQLQRYLGETVGRHNRQPGWNHCLRHQGAGLKADNGPV